MPRRDIGILWRLRRFKTYLRYRLQQPAVADDHHMARLVTQAMRDTNEWDYTIRDGRLSFKWRSGRS